MHKRKPTGDLGRETVMAELQQAINEYDGPLSKLAAEIGLSTSTVYNVRNEKTQWPRAYTMFGLLNATGRKLVISRK